jgi:hypothetical protein
MAEGISVSDDPRYAPAGAARECPQGAPRRLLHEIEDVLEALWPTVEGIRNLPLGRIFGEVKEGPQHRATPAEGRNHVVVILVRGEDVV